MSNKMHYLQSLEQLSMELRDAADEMEAALTDLTKRKMAAEPLDELKASHSEFLQHSTTTDAIARLNKLAQRMRDDDDLPPQHGLEADMISANDHALRMCTAMLDITKLLAGV